MEYTMKACFTGNRISLVLCCMVIAVFCFAADSSPQAAPKNLPIKGEVFTVEDRTAFLILPEKTKADEAVALTAKVRTNTEESTAKVTSEAEAREKS